MPLVIFGVGFAVFTALLLGGRIGEAAYCFLVATSALLGLVLHGFGRLKELDLKNLRLVLRGLEETKRDLFVREERLKAVLGPVAQILALTASSEGRWAGNRESTNIKREWYRQKVQALTDAMQASGAEAAEISKYMVKYAEFDRVFGLREVLRTTDEDYEYAKGRLESISAELTQMMKEDLKK